MSQHIWWFLTNEIAVFVLGASESVFQALGIFVSEKQLRELESALGGRARFFFSIPGTQTRADTAEHPEAT